MKDADRRPALVPAVALCVTLAAAASGGAWAGEEEVVPFPGPSVSGTSIPGAVEDGDGKTAEEAPAPLGAAAAGAAARPAVPGAAAGDETAAVPDAGADLSAPAGLAVDAGPPNAVVPDGAKAAEKADVPPGGSRLLRALVALEPEPGSVPGDVASSGSRRGFAAEGCPRALLRRLLAGAAGEADALSALGIEREILTLCRERQEILAGLFETEARLSELREAGRAPEPQTPVAPASVAPPVETGSPSPVRAAPAGAAENTNEADTPAGDARAAEPRPSRYAWFSIIGTAGALRAGVTDGTGVWFVREGDPLPGGATVAAIAGRPPGVRVTGARESGEATLLPFGARPGGVP